MKPYVGLTVLYKEPVKPDWEPAIVTRVYEDGAVSLSMIPEGASNLVSRRYVERGTGDGHWRPVEAQEAAPAPRAKTKPKAAPAPPGDAS